MRLLVWCGIIWMWFGAAVQADAPQPAELPPRDFAGGQYIDSAGCVFQRDGRAWVAALTEDQAQVCGFPPSRTAWAGHGPSLRPGSPGDEAAKIERDLLMLTVTTDGAEMALDDAVDLSAVGRTAAAMPANGNRASPGPRVTAKDGIGAEIARGLAMRRQVGAISPIDPPIDERLCALLGLRQAGVDPVAIGDDPTGGLCSGRAAKIAGYRLAGAAPMGNGQAAHGEAPRQADRLSGSEPAQKQAEAALGPGPKTAAKGIGSLDPSKPVHDVVRDGEKAAAARQPLDKVELIGPGARFVQIGRFDPAGAEIAAKALASGGYPVVRETRLGADGKRFVMAGPFATRAALIAALDSIRRAGYGSAVAR